MTDNTHSLREAALVSKAWPHEEARKVLKRLGGNAPAKGYALFETGYGPSGLPHIGTFNEVLRTTMVRRAFEEICDIPTQLIAFSDDMDGLRKVPDNVPNQEMLREHLGKPLTAIPDPFGKFDSFAAHNNAMLREFLDRFGFEYDFRSSTEQYKSGAFDEQLRSVLRRYSAIMDIMLPTLRAERAATYSPVLPVSPKSGIVLQVPLEVVDAEAGIVRFEDEGETIEHNILSGGAKLQWKVDWAMRWVALDVDYEMYGKDLTDSGVQSGKIAQVLGGRKPEGLIYEMFLDEKGEKDQQIQGQRPQPGGMADLWQRGKPRLLCLSRAEECEAAAYRRDPARGGRIFPVPWQLRQPAARQAARQPGAPYSCGAGGGCAYPGAARDLWACCSISSA
jgi:lysyl-tRNA synthetase class 1